MRWGRVEATAGFFLLVAWMNYWDSQCLVPAALLAFLLGGLIDLLQKHVVPKGLRKGGGDA